MTSRQDTQLKIKNIVFDALVGLHRAIHEHAYPPTDQEGVGTGKVWFGRLAASELVDMSPDTIDRWRKLPPGDKCHLPTYFGADGKPRFHIDDLKRILPQDRKEMTNG